MNIYKYWLLNQVDLIKDVLKYIGNMNIIIKSPSYEELRNNTNYIVENISELRDYDSTYIHVKDDKITNIHMFYMVPNTLFDSIVTINYKKLGINPSDLIIYNMNAKITYCKNMMERKLVDHLCGDGMYEVDQNVLFIY